MEIIRRAFRRILTTESSLYNAGATFLDFLATTRTDGYRTWCV